MRIKKQGDNGLTAISSRLTIAGMPMRVQAVQKWAYKSRIAERYYFTCLFTTLASSNIEI
jgi:hypothetical protein